MVISLPRGTFLIGGLVGCGFSFSISSSSGASVRIGGAGFRSGITVSVGKVLFSRGVWENQVLVRVRFCPSRVPHPGQKFASSGSFFPQL